MKKVQILLSTYNGEKYIREQLDSLLQQDYPNLEILIRDDGSKDSTSSILNEYKQKHSNIQLILDKNKGVISSFFELALNASDEAEFFAFCDQDDYWKSQKISRAVELLEKQTQNIPLLYFSRLNLVDENLNSLKQSALPPKGASFENALIQNIATGCTIVFNRALLTKFILNVPKPDQVMMHDSWFYLLANTFGQVIFDEQSYILYRQHSSNTLGMATNKIKSAIIRYKHFKKEGHKKPFTIQSEAFYQLYKNELSEKQKKLIENFLYKREYLSRRISYALTTPLYRQNKRDTVIFKLLYTINKY